MTDIPAVSTYVAMFDAYLTTVGDVPPAATPLVFHARKICEQLDAQIGSDAVTVSAKDSSYLRAIEALHVRLNPKPTATGAARQPEQVPGQMSVLDFEEE